jgi:hypothetical protein
MRYLIVALSLALSGCVNITVKEPLPEDTDLTVNVNISGWKSNAGDGNSVDQRTDANSTIPASILGDELGE